MVAQEKLNSLIADACKSASVTLVEADVFRAGKRKTLRIFIDKPEGVTIDDCTNVSHFLSDALDLDPELIEGAYTLEVSSPGIDRPLKSMADFERNKGRLLRVTRSTGKPVTGELLNADEENLTLKLKGNAGEIGLSRYFFNSLFVAVSGTLLHIIAASLAAFTLSKSKVRGRKALFWLLQIMLLYNAITLAIPRYYIYTKLHMIDTYWVYILPAIPGATGCFLMKQYMDVSVPDALMEAARIDGASVLRMYFSVIMPILKPAWMTMLLLSFQEMWTIVPQGTIFSEQLKTLPQVMNSISAGGIARSGSAMAVTVLLMIPPILVFLISQSNVMETMSTSGIKE